MWHTAGLHADRMVGREQAKKHNQSRLFISLMSHQPPPLLVAPAPPP
jgi:hypothetical protein